MLKKISLLVVLFLAVGFGKPENSSIEVKKTTSSDGKETIDFIVSASKGYVVNTLGPWKIKIKSSSGIVFSKAEIKMIKDTKNFRIYQKQAKEISKTGKIQYEAVVFVCTADKKICLRESHKGLSYSW